MSSDKDGEWRRDGSSYVLQARTRKSFGRFKIDASDGLSRGLAGLVTTHEWDRYTCHVSAPGATADVQYEPDDRGWKVVTVTTKIGLLGDLMSWMSFSWVRKKILSDIKHTTWQICGAAATDDRNVFIVHGHNHGHRQELANLVEDLGLHPIILDQEDDLGLTVIEKLEHYAKDCCFAFILMTADDLAGTPSAKRGSQDAPSHWRARQNVILELGYFMAYLGRERVVIVCPQALEIPSDIHGVVYLQFQESISEVREPIKRRLRGAQLAE